MKQLSVVIPSRTQARQAAFLDKAIQSIAKQAALDNVEIEIIVALDQGAQPPASFVCPANVRFVESHGHSQCAALNAGVQQARGEYLAFLEDDDAWHPYYAATAIAAIVHGDFVSSTQLELDEQGAVVRINDFATPSGWTMPMSTWQAIGAFDETYRFHLDNDWLGRLTRSGAKRIHMVEATAPVKLDVMQNVRPWLYAVMQCSGRKGGVIRHSHLTPLVNRLVHSASGTSRIAADPTFERVSNDEYSRLRERFGYVPW